MIDLKFRLVAAAELQALGGCDDFLHGGIVIKMKMNKLIMMTATMAMTMIMVMKGILKWVGLHAVVERQSRPHLSSEAGDAA